MPNTRRLLLLGVALSLLGLCVNAGCGSVMAYLFGRYAAPILSPSDLQ